MKNHLKIKSKSKNLPEYFELIFSITFGLFLIYNLWSKIVFEDYPSNLVFAFIGFVMLFDSPERFKKEVILAEDCIIYRGGNSASNWTKISEFEIKDKKLIIRSSLRTFRIHFDDINISDIDKITSFLNEKLSSLFMGRLVFDNELRIISDKA